ncbi:hypothetical protein BZL29_7891 [Mycobacterium kansasii]|uniref:Uncharacterized protein n=1 Tax=Mycobacterium kansasii TaxID=1768 RepID=A0A1V3WE30_MYCKA|nr:hypothetical protein BZL29_7891 [Mycobacterium kansasii]
MALFRHFATRTRIKRASAQALAQPLFSTPARTRGMPIAPAAIAAPSTPPGADVAQPQCSPPAPTLKPSDELVFGDHVSGTVDSSMPIEPGHSHRSAIGPAHSERSSIAAQWRVPECPDWPLTRSAQRRRRRRRRRMGAA